MLKNVSIKTKLFFLPVLVITSFVFMYLFMYSNFDKYNDKSFKASQSNKIIKQMLEARISEKNYIRRKDTKYAQEVIASVNQSLNVAQDLKKSFVQEENIKLVESVIENIKQYKKLFEHYQLVRDKSIMMQDIMIKEANDVEDIAMKIRKIQKKQRDKILQPGVSFEAITDEIEEASLANKIVKQLLNMRIAEKNYLRRKEIKYKNEVLQSIQNLQTLSLHIRDILDNSKNKEMIDSVIKALQEYTKAFDNFSSLREESIQISTKMKKEAREAESALLTLRKDQKNEKENLEDFFSTIITFLFFIVGLVILLSTLYIASSISRGIDRILKTTLGVINEDRRKEIEVNTNDELGKLAGTFNVMIKKIDEHIENLDSRVEKKTKELKEKIEYIQKTQNLLVENEKMAALGSLVAGVAHEINTPIGNSYTSSTYILDELHHMQDKYDEGKITKNSLKEFFEEGDTLLSSININLERASRLIRSFKQIAVDSSTFHITEINLKKYTEDILVSTKSLLKNTEINVELKIDEKINIKINPGDYAQVITNLIQNAVIHAFTEDRKGIISITIEVNDSIIINVCDDGVGISQENIEKIFNPFYTTNREGGGSGLGLNIVYNIVSKSLKGMIKCTSSPGEGTCFTIKIPSGKE